MNFLPKDSLSELETLFTSLGLSILGGSGGLDTNGDNVLTVWVIGANVIGDEGMTDAGAIIGDGGMTGDEGMTGDGIVGATLMIELCASFCSDELFDPGLTVGSGRFSNLNLEIK